MLRYTLDKLREKNNLLECNKEVDVVYEMGAVLKHFNNKRPMLFNKVKNYNMPSAGGLYGDRNLLYSLLGIKHEERMEYFMDGLVNPEPYRVVSQGPIKENIIKRNIDVTKMLPINKFQEKDSSSFITAGVMVIKDPTTGKYFTSIRRLQVNGPNELSVLIASPKLTNDFLNMEKLNKPMDVAIVFGYDAEFLMASQVSSATYGVDKYQIDSRLRGKPLELVNCETIDMLVPANCEIVIEGKIIPGKRKIEGPFGELMGYYGKDAPHPIMEVTAILHRNNPIYQTAFPCREEHVSNGIIREMELYYHLKNLVDVVDVNVTEGGGYRFNAFVSIKKKRDGDAKTAILAALGLNKDLKHVVIVDDDVDIFDIQDIEWAITTRAQASMDYTVVEGALGSSLEPSHDLRGVTDKVGVDATRPLSNEKFHKAIIPGYEKVDINKYFTNI